MKQTDCGNPNYKDILQASEVSEKVVEVINEEMKQLDICKQRLTSNQNKNCLHVFQFLNGNCSILHTNIHFFVWLDINVNFLF